MQRQTNQMPAWLMSSSAVVGIVGAILKKHAEKIREIIGPLGRPPQTARRAAHTGRALLIRRWEQATDRPLMVAAVIFLAAYAVPILAPSLPAWLLDLCQWLIWITWGILVVDIVVRLALADERLRYLIRHWYDVLMIALPLLRPLRLLRLIPLLSVLNRQAKIRLRGRIALYLAGGASLLAFCAAVAVLDAERSSPDANITDFGDAIWWAGSTMATVGYGDRYPVTGIGRLVGFGLMIGGIALLARSSRCSRLGWSRAFRRRRNLQRIFKPRSADLKPRSTNSRARRDTTSTRPHRR